MAGSKRLNYVGKVCTEAEILQAEKQDVRCRLYLHKNVKPTVQNRFLCSLFQLQFLLRVSSVCLDVSLLCFPF